MPAPDHSRWESSLPVSPSDRLHNFPGGTPSAIHFFDYPGGLELDKLFLLFFLLLQSLISSSVQFSAAARLIFFHSLCYCKLEDRGWSNQHHREDSQSIDNKFSFQKVFIFFIDGASHLKVKPSIFFISDLHFLRY